MRSSPSPWALAASRFLAAAAAAGAAVLAGLGGYAMVRTDASEGLPWLLAGAVLLPLALRLARGERAADPGRTVSLSVEPAAEEAHALLEPRLAS